MALHEMLEKKTKFENLRMFDEFFLTLFVTFKLVN